MDNLLLWSTDGIEEVGSEENAAKEESDESTWEKVSLLVCGTEMLCTKAGQGAATCCDKEMEVRNKTASFVGLMRQHFSGQSMIEERAKRQDHPRGIDGIAPSSGSRSMEYQNIELIKDEGIAFLYLNRPKYSMP